MDLLQITDKLVKDLQGLKFSFPISHVYNPLDYAREAYDLYLKRYGRRPKEVILVGMNPGPWGMIQTGVPFGEIKAVREWLGIEVDIRRPARLHPKRPVEGFHCKKSEVSGKRLWGWAKNRFITPDDFFSRFFVANYCPLMFIDSDGRNRTPDHVKAAERGPLLEVCDQALRQTAGYLEPRHMVGIGRFAAVRIKAALGDRDISIGRITHPSPANPRANRGWETLINRELKSSGIVL
jgi:single-strand selective monofunctional uracil DNA glycosylase